jgi:hypothetical protein
MAKISQSGEALLCRGVLHTAHRPSYRMQDWVRIGVMDHERRRRFRRRTPRGSQSSLRGAGFGVTIAALGPFGQLWPWPSHARSKHMTNLNAKITQG